MKKDDCSFVETLDCVENIVKYSDEEEICNDDAMTRLTLSEEDCVPLSVAKSMIQNNINHLDLEECLSDTVLDSKDNDVHLKTTKLANQPSINNNSKLLKEEILGEDEAQLHSGSSEGIDVNIDKKLETRETHFVEQQDCTTSSCPAVSDANSRMVITFPTYNHPGIDPIFGNTDINTDDKLSDRGTHIADQQIHSTTSDLSRTVDEGKILYCEICGKSFKNVSALENHKVAHEINPWVCCVCGMKFVYVRAASRHIRKFHPGIDPMSVCVKENLDTDEAQAGSGRSTETNKNADSKLERKTFSCDICDKAFKERRHLTTHKVTHTGEKAYSCLVCGIKFAHKPSVHRHMGRLHPEFDAKSGGAKQDKINKKGFEAGKLKHLPVKRYSCETCGKSFCEMRNLNLHKRIHTDEKRFCCDVCGKSFHEVGNLNTHKRIHDGVKPYQCDICGKAIRHSSALKSHRRIHTGERPYKCEVCGRGFTAQCNVTLHHARSHSGVKAYTCDICGKVFKGSDVMRRHRQIHLPWKPIPCDLCSRTYKSKKSMREHKARVHKQT